MGLTIRAAFICICLLVFLLFSATATANEVSVESAVFMELASRILSKAMTGIENPSGQIIAELREIEGQLTSINRRIDTLVTAVENVMRSIIQHHEMTRIVAAFSDDVRRIKYFRSLFQRSVKFDNTSQVIVDTKSKAWAEAILAVTSDGIDPTLFDIDKMIRGSFGTKPVVEVYMSGLILSNKPSIWSEVDRLVESLIQMQNMGYAYWGIALDITNRSDEKPDIKRMLDQRSTSQQPFLTVDDRFKKWPSGKYGLVQAATGCPDGSWSTGGRYHDTEDKDPANGWYPGNIANYISGSFNKNNLEWRFCMNPRVTKQGLNWPGGRYCVFAGSSSCPVGFRRGWLHLDDEDSNNRNRVWGSRPSGSYDRNTRYEFCCRSDGNVHTAIRLPLVKPFVLFPASGNACQKVENMKAREIYLHWDCEDRRNANKRGSPHPKETDGGRNMRIYMCHYSFQ